MTGKRQRIGKLGEERALEYLTQKGYRIVGSNIKLKVGEIDILAEVDNFLVFVEVKTRSSDIFGEGYEAVDKRKQNKLRQLALTYLQGRSGTSRMIRFDVISILLGSKGEVLRLRHFEAAF